MKMMKIAFDIMIWCKGIGYFNILLIDTFNKKHMEILSLWERAGT